MDSKLLELLVCPVTKGLLEYDCATDAVGNITFGPAVGASDWGVTRLATDAFYTGDYACEDLTGLTDAAIAAAGWRLVSGSSAHGIVRLP